MYMNDEKKKNPCLISQEFFNHWGKKYFYYLKLYEK
jgi:hypothetical protein